VAFISDHRPIAMLANATFQKMGADQCDQKVVAESFESLGNWKPLCPPATQEPNVSTLVKSQCRNLRLHGDTLAIP
jgi:hypothetical protein